MQIRGTTLLMILVKDTPNESSLKHITVSTDVSTPVRAPQHILKSDPPCIHP